LIEIDTGLSILFYINKNRRRKMVKIVNLAKAVPGYKSGAEDFIVENRKNSKVNVISRKELETMNPNMGDRARVWELFFKEI
jgi:hypothetical protein